MHMDVSYAYMCTAEYKELIFLLSAYRNQSYFIVKLCIYAFSISKTLFSS